MFRGTLQFHKRVLIYQTHVIYDKWYNRHRFKIKAVKKDRYRIDIWYKGIRWHQ